MSEPVQIELLPLGQVLEVQRGAALQDILFAHGVEFPCGGRGRCKGCKIKLLAGSLPITEDDRSRLSTVELADGWRLACRARVEADLKIDLAQWEAAILSDDSTFAFKPRAGLGVAVDLGTTTIVAQLLDLQSGQVLAVRTALNAQAKHGADVMSRVEFAVASGGQPTLERLIRDQVATLIDELLRSAGGEHRLSGQAQPSPAAGSSTVPVCQPGTGGERPPEPAGEDAGVTANTICAEAPRAHAEESPPRISGTRLANRSPLESIVVVGNTVMHHLFSGVTVEPLSRYPFEPASPGLQVFTAAGLGWDFPGNPQVYFLPCLGGFVGSDILAGVLATKLHERDSLAMLIDLGTNGEIILGNRERLLCAATAAGPAFEGARISMGMRAATGAIAEVRAASGHLHCHVLGNTTPRGICGSGLVDAVAASLDLGWILPSGRLASGEPLLLASPVLLNQWDIRELQLAKGAIAAGVRILLEQWGAGQGDLTEVFLAGAFGNYINQANARRIGLLEFPSEKIVPAGNTALLGAKLALFNLHETKPAYADVLRRVTHISLNEAPGFQDTYVEKMAFPEI